MQNQKVLGLNLLHLRMCRLSRVKRTDPLLTVELLLVRSGGLFSEFIAI
jgi:hypothetical protein